MTLTETAAATKKWLRIVLIFGSIFLVVWITALFLYNNVWVPYSRNQVRPEQRFGQLPKPKFAQTLSPSNAFQYSLDTSTGALPTDMPRLLNVYFIPPQATTLLAPDRAKKLANSLGFKSEPEILSPSEYRYTDTYGGQLTVELSTGNFNFTKVVPDKNEDGRPPEKDPVLPNETDFKQALKNMIGGAGSAITSFQDPRVVVSYDNPNHQLAQTARVSFWPSNIEDLPVVTDNTVIGPISAIGTKYTEPFRFTKLDFKVWTYDPQTFSTYQLRPIKQAFDDLQNGQAVVIRTDNKSGPASITQVYLAYYMSADYQPYLQPIYVFEGESFTAYTTALTPESYIK